MVFYAFPPARRILVPNRGPSTALRRLLPLAFLYLLISFWRKIGKQKFFAWVFIHAFCGVAFKCLRNVRIVSQHHSGPVTYPAWESLTLRYEPGTTQRR